MWVRLPPPTPNKQQQRTNTLVLDIEYLMTKEVIIYTAAWCAGCTTLKNALDSKGVKYTAKDVDDVNNLKELQFFKVKGIPFTLIGDTQFIGSSEETILEIIKASEQ